MITYETSCGEHIKSAIGSALNLSLAEKKESLCPDVVFDFNGIKMVVNYSLGTLAFYGEEWENKCEERNTAYKNSQEFKDAEIRARRALETSQSLMNLLDVSFKDFIATSGIDTSDTFVINWFIKAIDLMDYSGVVYDKKQVTTYLKKQGHVRNAFVGYEGNWTKENKLSWIYGQILEGFYTTGCPHPIFKVKLEEILKGGIA